MDTTSINEFSILSPSQKKELERKRKEQEAREAEEAAIKAEAVHIAKEKAIAEGRRIQKEKETEISRQKLRIGILTTLLIVIIWVWLHYFGVFYLYYFDESWYEDCLYDQIRGVIFYFIPTSIITLPTIFIIGVVINDYRDKLKEITKYE